MLVAMPPEVSIATGQIYALHFQKKSFKSSSPWQRFSVAMATLRSTFRLTRQNDDSEKMVFAGEIKPLSSLFLSYNVTLHKINVKVTIFDKKWAVWTG